MQRKPRLTGETEVARGARRDREREYEHSTVLAAEAKLDQKIQSHSLALLTQSHMATRYEEDNEGDEQCQ